MGRIEHAFLNNEYALAVFLDIQGAYDNLTIGAIIRALRDRGCDELFVKWIHDLLKFRMVTIDYKGVSVTRYPTNGVPQGGGNFTLPVE